MNTYRKSQIPPHLLEFFEPAEIGLEPTPDQFIAKLVEVFREVKRVLADDGTLWLNIGDSYASYRDGKATPDTTRGDSTGTLVPKGSARNRMASTFQDSGVKHKDLIGIPWMLAFALRADGWYLRQDIIWHKPNPMPESVRDRCTKAHEYIFLLSKSERYFFDSEAIQEPADPANFRESRGIRRTPDGQADQSGFRCGRKYPMRNKRDVWSIAVKPYKGAHFATFPTALVEPCILAGAPAGAIVLDPFFGSGTTGQVAQALGRQFIGLELNEAYKPLQDERLRQPSLLLEAA